MPERNNEWIDRQTAPHGVLRELARVVALLAAGGAFIFVLTSLLFSL